MAPVLVLISIPYDDTSKLNEKLAKNEAPVSSSADKQSQPDVAEVPDESEVKPKKVEGADTQLNDSLQSEVIGVEATDGNIESVAPSTSTADAVEEELTSKKSSVAGKSSSTVDDSKDESLNDQQAEEQKNNGNEKKTSVVESKKKNSNAVKSFKRLMSYYDMTKVCKNILNKFKVQKATWLRTECGEHWQIMFQLDSKYCDDILNNLLQAGIGNNEYTSVSIVPITVNFPSMIPESEDMLLSGDITDDIKTEKSEFLQSVKSKLTVAQVINSVRVGSQLTFDYIMLLILASIIAAVGLFENSSVLLVASMLVSPLMGPIMGGTFGLVLWYKPVWKPAILNELLGLSICLIMGFLFGILCGVEVIPGWNIVTTEMTSRGAYRSLYVGVLIAIPSGAAVALSILGGNVGSLVGVAISASLLPPAVNAGVFWAFAIICSIQGPIPPKNSTIINSTATMVHHIPQVTVPLTLRHFEPTELWKYGAISLTLTIVNIFIVFLMGVVILKIKEVIPKTGTAITTKFWKVDLKRTRAILHGHKEQMPVEDLIEEQIIEDWSRINKINLQNEETLRGREGAAVAKELKNFIDDVEIENKAFYNKLNDKSGTRILDHMKKKLEESSREENLRFRVVPVTIPLETTFVSRFTKTKLDTVDNKPITRLQTTPALLGLSTETHRGSSTRIHIPIGNDEGNDAEQPLLSGEKETTEV